MRICAPPFPPRPAPQENRERKAAEQRLLKRERLNLAKRRSVATCSAAHEAPHPELDATGLESVLQTFLSSRPAQRRPCPARRPPCPLSPIGDSPTDAVPHAHTLEEAGTAGGKEAPPKRRLVRLDKGWSQISRFKGIFLHRKQA